MSSLSSTRDFFSRHRSAFSLGLIALMISSIGDLVAGATLGFMTDTLALLPGLMVLIPPAIGMRGNIFGALGSRLGTSMHLGTFEMSLERGSILRQNLESSLLLTVVMSLLMGILAKAVTGLLGVTSISVEAFAFISMVGGVLSGLVLVLINVLVALIGFRRSWDIDNISAPIITAAGDVVTLPMLFLAAILVMNTPEMAVSIAAVLFLLLAFALSLYALRLKRSEVRRIFMHSTPVLTLCVLLDLAAGLTVEHRIEGLITLPALLVMLPPFLEDANALGGILTSRLSSELHLGTIEPRGVPGHLALENFAIMYLFSLWVFTLVGISSYLVAILLGLGSPSLVHMVALSLAAGLITVTFLNILSYYVAIYTYRLSLDPDDHSIPLTSSAIDSIGAVALISMIVVMGLG